MSLPAQIPLYQVDAFTSEAFRGNPAAVCPLEAWLPVPLMQKIAAENNLSETAFFIPDGDGFALRWFTPTTEVDLCGHATLASAFVLMTELSPARTRVVFSTRSGPLTVERAGDKLTMDFPSRPATQLTTPFPALSAGLGRTPVAVWTARSFVAVFEDAETVRGLRPDFAKIAALDTYGVIVTAPGTGADADVDCVSRFFAPRQGVPEDPVTGSAHCTLAPYWAARLGRPQLRARQVSARGGEIDCELRGDRVSLSGQAVLVIQGTLRIPPG
ncbi:MAG TPA: PhzF family phenazine biosynthesis protein [Polyangia bacterium]|jgi:PhzF family phenazine biosynthesis protein